MKGWIDRHEELELRLRSFQFGSVENSLPVGLILGPVGRSHWFCLSLAYFFD